MANSEKYVHVPNAAAFREHAREISYKIVEMINNANFYDESMNDKEEVLNQSRKASKAIERDFSSLMEFVDKDYSKGKKKQPQVKSAVRKHVQSQKELPRNESATEHKKISNEEALEELKENLKKLRSQFNT